MMHLQTMMTRAARPNPPVSFRLKNRSEGPLIAHIHMDPPPDVHPQSLLLSLRTIRRVVPSLRVMNFDMMFVN
jgi:hypothetical protein